MPTKFQAIGCLILAAVGALALTSDVSAQHLDVLLQDVNKRLTSGSADFDSGQWALGRRVYTQEFDSDYAVNDPGFNSLAAGSPALPAGSEALPGNKALGWDFLPLKIDDVAANLFYWDGIGSMASDVDFGSLPGPDYELSLFGRFNAVGVDGAAELVPGDVINNTAANGTLHEHRFFFLDDGDDNPLTTPADGIYLFSIRATMEGLDDSAPIYLVWGTPGSMLAALQAAELWVNDRVDDLAPEFDADFDRDLDVDGADFLTWQRDLGMSSALQIHGDADRDHWVGAGDLAVWREEYGISVATFPGAPSAPMVTALTAIPEPRAIWLAVSMVAALALAYRKSRLSGDIAR